MILEGVVILAIAKPLTLSDGRHSRCVIGYSKDLKSLIRLYPTYAKSKKIKEGNVLKVKVIKGDDRENTFKLKGSKNLKKADRKIKIISKMSSKALYNMLNGMKKTTIKELNDNKLSMGIIQPDEYEVFQKDDKYRMSYSDGDAHNQQILDHEVKQCNNPLLIVGNHHRWRNSFMVVSWRNGV